MADEPHQENSNPINPASSANPSLERAAEAAAKQVIPPALETALRKEGIDTGDPNVTRTLEFSMKMMLARGPLPMPPPSLLIDYEGAHPGLIQKIIGWTDQQREHRQKLEKQVTEGDERRMNRGQLIAAFVAIWGLTLASAVGIFGNAWAAGVIAIVAIGGPTAAIWLARQGDHSQPKPPTQQKDPEPPMS